MASFELSPSELFAKALAALGQSPTPQIYSATLPSLIRVSNLLRSSATFSPNEEIDDVQTTSLKFLALPYWLGMCECYGEAPGGAEERRRRLMRGREFLVAFVGTCEKMRIVEPNDIPGFEELVYQDGGADDDEGNLSSRSSRARMTAGESREAKIARFKLSQKLSSALSQLRGLSSRRSRLDLAPSDDLEGHGDEENMMREVEICELKRLCVVSLDEINGIGSELEMVNMMAEMEKSRGVGGGGGDSRQQQQKTVSPPTPHQLHNGTATTNLQQRIPNLQINQDPATGQLVFKREQVRDGVFRPFWNLPTMSLEEFGDREYAEAMERAEKEKASEIASKNAPRRYEYLKRDGLEDDIDKVDASAKKDRDWDDFKDENPRGSGNKKGELGDRNF